VNEAKGEPRRGVRRHAWFHCKPGSCRVSEDGPLQAMLSKLRSSLLHPGVSGSRVAGSRARCRLMTLSVEEFLRSFPLRYLGAYTHRVAISNHRLVARVDVCSGPPKGRLE